MWLPINFQQIHMTSISGHCIHFSFKICQTVACISQYNEIFWYNFWRNFCHLAQPCATAAKLAGIGVVPVPVRGAAPTCEYTKHKTFFEASEYIAAAVAATYSYTRTAAFSSWERSLILTTRTTWPRGRYTVLCDVLYSLLLFGVIKFIWIHT